MYIFLRFFLFILPTETSHYLALNGLKMFNFIGVSLLPTKSSHFNQSKHVFGICFRNPVGIAAGLDKNGDYIDALANLGVGFIEVGAVTPEPQIGNPKPRLFRLKEDSAIINRMGFNNKGVDYLVNNLKKRTTPCRVGVNLGKNTNTPLEQAKDDYNYCIKKVYRYCDFLTINISSPNTPDLRKLQTQEYIEDLLGSIKKECDQCQTLYGKHIPLLVKIAPDLDNNNLHLILDTIEKVGLDGIIATNTTCSRAYPLHSPLAKEQGGLSGKPLQTISGEFLHKIKKYSPNLPTISVGGIDSMEIAEKRMNDGACLIQVYTGLIYNGVGLINSILHALWKNKS